MSGFIKSALAGLLVGLMAVLPAQATTIYATGGGSGSGVIKTTVGGLPTCTSGTQGRVYAVTDATTNTCTAGGASHELCICDGASWVIVGDGTAAPGAVVFTDVGAGTNTNALVVGTGGTLSASGTGTITATSAPDAAVNGVTERDEVVNWACVPTALTRAAVQTCVTSLEATAFGGTVLLDDDVYVIDATPILVSGAVPITFQGAGTAASFLRCTTANGCTAPSIVDVLVGAGTPYGVVFKDLFIEANRGSTPVDGIRIGEPKAADCTAADIPADCCTGAGVGATCGSDYINGTIIDNVSYAGSATQPRIGVGIRHWGLNTTIRNSQFKNGEYGIWLGGNTNGTSNSISIDNCDIRGNKSGIINTVGSWVAGVADTPAGYNVLNSLFESNAQYGIELVGGNANTDKPVLKLFGSWFEGNDSSIHETGGVAGQPRDWDILSIGNVHAATNDGEASACTGAAAPRVCCSGVGTGPDCDADTVTDAIVLNANSDTELTSLHDKVTAAECITHSGTGFVNLMSPEADFCTPNVAGGTAVLVDYDKLLSVVSGVGATDDFCLQYESTGNTLKWAACSPGTGDITAVGAGYASGAAFTDGLVTAATTEFLTWEGTADDANEYHWLLPAANPTSDISWTMPAVTGTLVGNLDTGTVNSTVILNDTISELDLAADLAFADGDSLNLTAITLSATGEGLIVTSPADCNALTGLTAGTVCYDTTDDAICVYDGAAMDCQILGAAGSGDVTDVGDCAGPACFTTAGVGTNLFTDSNFIIDLDNNNDGSGTFQIQESSAETVVFQVDEVGAVTLPATGSIAIPANATDGQSVILFEDTTFGGQSWTLDMGQTDIGISSLVVGIRADGGLDFGTSMNGTLVAAGFYTDNADPADTGSARLGNAETICWEASVAGTDVCITADASEIIDVTGGTFNAADVVGTLPATADGTTPAADDDGISLATTAYVQTEINALGGAGLTCAAGSCATTSSEASFVASGTIAPASDGALVIDTDGDGVNILNDVLGFQSGTEDFFVFAVREYPTVNGQILKFNSTNDDVEWATDADSGGAPALNAVTGATGTATINNAENAIVWGWDTAATTLATTTAFTFNYTNDATIDSFDQTVVSIGRPASAGTAASLSLLRLENLDTDGLVTNGILFDVAAGLVTTAIDASDAQIGTALSIGANDILMTTGNIITAAQTIDSTELDRLNGKDAALIDTNDTAGGLTTLTGTTLTLGDGGDFTALTVDAGATDPVFTFSSDSVVVTGAATFNHVDGSIPTADLATEVRSMYWGAGALSTDGTDCQTPAEVTIASGPKFYTVACAMASSETDGFIHGSTVLPDSINIAADVTFEVTARVLTDNAGATAHGYMEIQCVAADSTVGSTWSSGTDLDVTQVVGDVADDILQDTSGAVDLAQGANPDCVGGDTMFWRYKVCDTDTVPSTGCTSSAGAENDHHYVGFKMEYTTDIGDVL